MKRKNRERNAPSSNINAKKARHEEEDASDESEETELTPSKRAVGRPRGPNWTPKRSKLASEISTPTGTTGRKLFSTPLKTNTLVDDEDATPTIARNADRSARRKSARNLVERTLGDNESDLEEEEDELARDIYGEEDAEDEEDDVILEDPEDPVTPSKRASKRTKSGRTRKRTPTPPIDLPPHELYFFQNRPGRQKTSENTLASLALLDHEEYFSITRELEDPHAQEIKYLHDLHSSSFNRWRFELSQGFNICIYGWGSKHSLLTKFAEHIYNSQPSDENKIVIVNGYTHTTTFRDIFNTITTAVLGPSHNFKLGSQPVEMLETLLSLLTEAANTKSDFRLTLIVNSIDATPLRKPMIQNLLSRLASHPNISLIASADHPSFPLLWDSSLRSTYDFLFHDCTSFQPFEAELDVVNSVHELLGRSGRRVGGKEGISFVLKSLPENAKKLFGVLVAEQLAGMDGGIANDDGSRAVNGNQEIGVEYRVLYQKAVEEFICSAEMGFRTLLKEFYDHQMIESRKDSLGTEILSVPFRKEELETILEDLMS